MGYTGGIYTHGMQQLCQPCHYGGGLWSRLLEVFELLGVTGGEMEAHSRWVCCVLTDFQLLGEIHGMFFQETCDMRR